MIDHRSTGTKLTILRELSNGQLQQSGGNYFAGLPDDSPMSEAALRRDLLEVMTDWTPRIFHVQSETISRTPADTYLEGFETRPAAAGAISPDLDLVLRMADRFAREGAIVDDEDRQRPEFAAVYFENVEVNAEAIERIKEKRAERELREDRYNNKQCLDCGIDLDAPSAAGAEEGICGSCLNGDG